MALLHRGKVSSEDNFARNEEAIQIHDDEEVQSLIEK